MESRFNRHPDRLAERHGDRVWRLGVDAGFSCPHRSQGRGRGGCSFCSPEAGLATYQHDGLVIVEDLVAQICRAAEFNRRRYDASLFFLYFQAYSCTNLPPPELKALYDRAISIFNENVQGRLCGIVVSTRPDCFDSEKAALLSDYRSGGMEIWVEFGLQSSDDATLRRINRGHTAEDFRTASLAASLAGLKVAVHVMLGLPGESRRQMIETVRFAAECGIAGIKFHDLKLCMGSSLAREFPLGEFAPLHPDRLPGILADCLEILPPGVEVMRLGADFPKGTTIDVFPRRDKFWLYDSVEKLLAERGSRQGMKAPPPQGG